MAKGQRRGNREKKKPKADRNRKVPAGAAAVTIAGTPTRPLRGIFK